MTPQEILDSFKSETCLCGRGKKPMMSHCRGHYYELPLEMRQALYRRFGDGYEEAFIASAEFLKIGPYAEQSV